MPPVPVTPFPFNLDTFLLPPFKRGVRAHSLILSGIEYTLVSMMVHDGWHDG